MSFKLRPTKEELILRIENSLKLKDVADSYNVSQQSVIKWMKFYEIFESHNFKRNVGQGKPWKGKSLSEETKAKISSSKTGVSTGRRVEYERVTCPICGKEFERKRIQIDNIVQKNVLEATEKVKPTKNYMEKIDQRK